MVDTWWCCVQELGRGSIKLSFIEASLTLQSCITCLQQAGLAQLGGHSTPSLPPGKHRAIRMACFE